TAEDGAGGADEVTRRRDVGGVAASRGARRALEERVRVDRLDVQPLERRELGAEDHGEVVAARDAAAGRGAEETRPTVAGELLIDLNEGEVGLEVRRPGRDRRDTREVTGRVGGAVRTERGERLQTG